MIRIGVDFDNTIICYDEVFQAVALEQGLIHKDLPPGKDSVRNFLRSIGKEDQWTELQGLVYGSRIDVAKPFPGVIDFFLYCRQNIIPVNIISHKTKYPYRGPRYDLHQAAFRWLELHGFFGPEKIGLSKKQVFFELSKDQKMDRIAQLKCTHFIDDLPEFLYEPSFPENVKRILFDPNGNHLDGHDFEHITSWNKIQEYYMETRI
ncbi:haloacid dehalogenase-like hydrolase [Thermodesulfobacteriota bacterium]